MAVQMAKGSAANKGKKKGVATSKAKVPSGKKVTTPQVAYVVASGEAVTTWRSNGLAHVKEYLVLWSYRTATTSSASGMWLPASTSAQSVGTNTSSTFTVPEGATAVRASVKPVSTQYECKWQTKQRKQYKSGANKGKWYWQWTQHKEQVDYWTGAFAGSEATATGASVAPKAPATPVLSADSEGRVTIGLSSEAGDDLVVEVWRYQDGLWASHGGGTLVGTYSPGERTVTNAFVALQGHSYRVDARQVNVSTGVESGWSSFSTELAMPPLAPKGLSVASTGATSFLATWEADGYTGDGFELRWGPDPDVLTLDELPGDARSATTDGATAYSAQVDPGTWHFVVRATGTSPSPWSDAVSHVGGASPQPPTIVGLPAYAGRGAPLVVEWVHNASDGSSQEGWEAQWRAGSGEWQALSSASTGASSCAFDTLQAQAGQLVAFRVRTRNAVGWSDWAESRAVTVEAAPEVTVAVPADVGSLPVAMTLSSSSEVRMWHLLVVSEASATVLGPGGGDVVVPQGAVAFEGVMSVGDEGFDGTSVEVTLDLTNAALYSGVRYRATLTGVTPHGLSGSCETSFLVRLAAGDAPSPSASIAPVGDDLEAHVFPVCEGEDGMPRDDVTLSVWRIDSDGEPLLIADGVPNDGASEVIDPHPNFGECWYRVAATAANGSMGFYDAVVEVECGSVVIQFEDGTNGYSPGLDTGDLIELPYGVEVTEAYEGDAALVPFIGNSDPTLYTGTQLGRKASVSSTVLKTDDPEVVSRVRRLAGSLSRAYYRDPSGLGFWAWVRPTIRHRGSLLAEASFEVTRIMGGYEGRLA